MVFLSKCSCGIELCNTASTCLEFNGCELALLFLYGDQMYILSHRPTNFGPRFILTRPRGPSTGHLKMEAEQLRGFNLEHT